MKICVTSQGGNLDSLVDPRFGRCAYFIIYDTEKDSFESLSNPNISSPSGAGISSAQFVANKGVNAVLTGNVGPNSFGVFQASGIQVITGLAGLTVKEAIDKFKKGQLKPTPNPNVSGHFGMMGPSALANNPQQNIPYSTPGFMPGFGMGRGMGMGRGRFFQPGFYPQASQPQISKEQELQFLKQQLEFLKQQMSLINQRIQELEKGGE